MLREGEGTGSLWGRNVVATGTGGELLKTRVMNESRAEIEWHAGSRPQEQVRAPRLYTQLRLSPVSKDSRIATDDH